MKTRIIRSISASDVWEIVGFGISAIVLFSISLIAATQYRLDIRAAQNSERFLASKPVTAPVRQTELNR